MAATYKNKVQSDNKHLANLTSARYVHFDGGTTGTTTVIAAGTSCRVLRLVNTTKGINLIVRSGSRVIGQLATTSVEGTYDYGVHASDGLQVDVVSGTGSATLVFGE